MIATIKKRRVLAGTLCAVLIIITLSCYGADSNRVVESNGIAGEWASDTNSTIYGYTSFNMCFHTQSYYSQTAFCVVPSNCVEIVGSYGEKKVRFVPEEYCFNPSNHTVTILFDQWVVLYQTNNELYMNIAIDDATSNSQRTVQKIISSAATGLPNCEPKKDSSVYRFVFQRVNPANKRREESYLNK